MINACNSRRVWSVALAHHEWLNLLSIAPECCHPSHLKLRFLKARMAALLSKLNLATKFNG
jgi:hypothetical protein